MLGSGDGASDIKVGAAVGTRPGAAVAPHVAQATSHLFAWVQLGQNIDEQAPGAAPMYDAHNCVEYTSRQLVGPEVGTFDGAGESVGESVGGDEWYVGSEVGANE